MQKALEAHFEHGIEWCPVPVYGMRQGPREDRVKQAARRLERRLREDPKYLKKHPWLAADFPEMISYCREKGIVTSKMLAGSLRKRGR